MGMKLTRNEQLAHDLVQEALMTVWTKAPLYDLDRGTAQSWIFTLTRNRCFDMLRKKNGSHKQLAQTTYGRRKVMRKCRSCTKSKARRR